MLFRKQIFIFCFILCCTKVQAEILTPYVPGGLTILQPREISIHRQDVAIDPNWITISYVFKNNFSLDLIETLAFELPPTYAGSSAPFQGAEEIEFSVNGKPVHPMQQKRAISKSGEDISAKLKLLGLTTNPSDTQRLLSENTQKSIELKNHLHAQGLLEGYAPLWFEKTIFYWKQQFKATKELYVRQRYSSKLSAVEKINQNKPLAHCQITPEASQMLQDHSHMQSLFFGLKQDSNWSRPIRRFTLRVSAPKYQTPLVCWPHRLENQGNNQFLFHAENFVPLENVYLYYLR